MLALPETRLVENNRDRWPPLCNTRGDSRIQQARRRWRIQRYNPKSIGRAHSQIASMTSPPKEKPGAGEQTGHNPIQEITYSSVAFPANIFPAIVRLFERRNGRVGDRLENQWSGR
jgi:hypothetical protein